MARFHKVIIAEDDLSTRRTIAGLVESCGFAALESSDGERAWDLLLDNPSVELIISDIAMPRMNGRELITKLRNDSKFAELPLIVVSGVVGPHEIAELIQLGASRFLAKPVHADHLRDYIRALVRPKKRADLQQDGAGSV